MSEIRENTTEITRGDLSYSLRRKPRKTRARRLARDQFGRSYVYWEDLNAEAPVGLIDHMFSAPINVPDQYLKFDADRPWRVSIDFKSWLRDTLEEERQWEERLKEAMHRLYKEKGDEAMAPGGTGPTPAALQVVGRKPVSSQLIRVMGRGDRWCLGLQRKRTPVVEALIGKEVEETAAERRRREKQQADAAFTLPPELEALMQQSGATAEAGFEDDADEARLAKLSQLDREDDEASGASGSLDDEPETDDEAFGDGEDDEIDLDDLDLSDLDDDEDLGPSARAIERPAKARRNPRMPKEA